MVRFAGVLFAGLLGVEAQAATPSPAPLVQTRFVAELDRAVPGAPLRVGLLYTVAPGWHIYWENPGDSGLATELSLEPGPGLSVGPVEYPGPERFVLPGDIVNFGYEGEAALMATVTPRAQLRTGERVQVRWSSAWLVCREECLRGKAEGTFELPVGQASAAVKTGALDRFVERLPTPLPAGAAAWAEGGVFRVTVPDTGVVTAFPNPALAAGGPVVTPTPNGVNLRLDPAHFAPDAAGLGGVVHVETTSAPRWYSFTVPWPPPAGP